MMSQREIIWLLFKTITLGVLAKLGEFIVTKIWLNLKEKLMSISHFFSEDCNGYVFNVCADDEFLYMQKLYKDKNPETFNILRKVDVEKYKDAHNLIEDLNLHNYLDKSTALSFALTVVLNNISLGYSSKQPNSLEEVIHSDWSDRDKNLTNEDGLGINNLGFGHEVTIKELRSSIDSCKGNVQPPVTDKMKSKLPPMVDNKTENTPREVTEQEVKDYITKNFDENWEEAAKFVTSTLKFKHIIHWLNRSATQEDINNLLEDLHEEVVDNFSYGREPIVEHDEVKLYFDEEEKKYKVIAINFQGDLDELDSILTDMEEEAHQHHQKTTEVAHFKALMEKSGITIDDLK